MDECQPAGPGDDLTAASRPADGSQSLPPPVRALCALFFLIVIGFVIAYAVHIQVATYTPVPFVDLWAAVDTAQAASTGDLGLDDLWAQHNEHRILVPRLQFMVEYALFGGTFVFLLGMILVSSVVLAALMTWPVAEVWPDRAIVLGFLTVALTVTLTPAGWENLAWPFQVGLVQVYLFSVAAITLAVQRLTPRPAPTARWGRILWPAAVVALGGAATYSSANGLVMWPLIVAVLLIERAERKLVVIVGLAGAVFTASYLWGYEPVSFHTPYRESIADPVGVARFVTTFLGHPAQAVGQHAVEALGLIGLAALLGLIVVAIRNLERPDNRPTVWGAAVATFVLVTATQTALGRLDFGLAQALSSRYAIAVGVFWIGLAVGFAPVVARSVDVAIRARARRIDVTGLVFVTILLAIALVGGLAAAPPDPLVHHLRTRSEPMLVAYSAGVRDDAAFMASHPAGQPVIAPLLEWLRAEELGPWNSAVARALTDGKRPVPSVSRLTACNGVVDVVTPVREGERLDGWIVAPPRTDPGRGLAVVDQSGQPDGVGLAGFYRPDVKASGQSPRDTSGFVAYTRSAHKPAMHLVMLDSVTAAPLCALSITRP